ncbi:MAG: histidinol-phosphatase [Rhodospirillaceae bacterium]|nr:histidinol-phosphatase [Rhodospirillaceae bacterium]
MSNSCPTDFIEFANKLADASGVILRDYFRKPISVTQKLDQTPVSIADQEVEKRIRQLISETYPDHGVWGEEQGVDKQDAEFLWVIDPIDGTKSYLAGRPIFGTLISLVCHGKPILGIIDQPILNERWQGMSGFKTRFNNTEVSTRNCSNIENATLSATSPDMFNQKEKLNFLELSGNVSMTIYGGDCYSYGLLANGLIDLIVEADLKPYDFCALVPIIMGAGGSITDWQGNELNIRSDGRIIAAGNSELIPQVKAVLTG